MELISLLTHISCSDLSMSTQDNLVSQEDLVPTQEALFYELEEDEAQEETGGKPPRARWEGSEVSSAEIEWLYNSRRIPRAVECRRPGSELSPEPQSGEYVVFSRTSSEDSACLSATSCSGSW